MKVKDIIDYHTNIFIKRDEGNKYYDEWNWHLIPEEILNAEIKRMQVDELMGEKIFLINL
jgi:hypothetical protein